MVFSSLFFLFVFLPVVLAGHYVWRNRSWQNAFLLFVSLFFYAWGEGERLYLMVISIALNFAVGRLLEGASSEKHRKWFLASGVFLNLLMLVIFKYTNFLIENLNVLLSGGGIDPVKATDIRLPIGISFYTFQAISYIVDVYRRQTPAQRNILDLGLYISLFPQLIAGPIVRYHDVAGQIRNRLTDMPLFVSGVRKFCIGLGKKVLIANTLAYPADMIFSFPEGSYSPAVAWLGIVCYSLQLYFDFSGYSDMAIGLGRMFGFRFLENFNYPYISRSIKEFWRRWHISLSQWFRDYLYIPLGGSRISVKRTYINLIIVFFLTGLWHGASWNFVIWGLFHGLFLILERLGLDRLLQRAGRVVQHLYVILIALIAWVFFRAEDLASSIHYIQTLAGIINPDTPNYTIDMLVNPLLITVLILAMIGSTPVLDVLEKRWERIAFTPLRVTGNMCVSLFYLGVVFLSAISLINGTMNPFIYFRF